MANSEKIIPRQKIGGRTGASGKREMPTRHEAILLFNDAVKRLKDVNRWHILCGHGSAEFHLCDEKGGLLYSREASKGHFIRISHTDLETGKTARRWVAVEELITNKTVIKDEEIFGLKLRSANDPEGLDPQEGHGQISTSTFVVIRNTNEVEVIETEGEENPNVGPRAFLNKMKNVVIAFAALIGLSTPQWKSLVNGVLYGEPQ
jgi:hypothetical protein